MNSSLLAALAAVFLAGCAQPEAPRASSHRPSPSRERTVSRREADSGLEVTVKRVVDGDTLLVSGLPKGTGLVRLTGVNAPETGDGRTTRECFGVEARRWLADQAPPGTRLRLVLDVGERDRFGRLLAYVYRADGAFLNADLVANGYARTMTIRPNVRHAKELQALQQRARSRSLGLWAHCGDPERR